MVGALEGERQMLRSMKDLEGYAIHATDGTIGHVKDFYFDDTAWVVRYLIVETGNWLSSRKVLISPMSIGQPDWNARALPVSITKEQVKNSPDIDTDKPVSRQHELQYLAYYNYPYYWGGAGLWGAGAYPGMLTGLGYDDSPTEHHRARAQDDHAEAEGAPHPAPDPHLRSCKAVMKYHIEATDGDIGHVQGLLVDEETWAIRYMIVATSNWWPGHQVLVAPQWIHEVRWADTTVSVRLTRQAVKDAPQYDAAVPLRRDREEDLYRHHGHAGYWAHEVSLQNPEFRVVESSRRGATNKARDSVT
jgi:hypothetical protein